MLGLSCSLCQRNGPELIPDRCLLGMACQRLPLPVDERLHPWRVLSGSSWQSIWLFWCVSWNDSLRSLFLTWSWGFRVLIGATLQLYCKENCRPNPLLSFVSQSCLCLSCLNFLPASVCQRMMWGRVKWIFRGGLAKMGLVIFLLIFGGWELVLLCLGNATLFLVHICWGVGCEWR
jgi:hypothetical protein